LKWIDHVVVIASADSLSRMEEILAPFAKQQQKRFDCIAGDRSRHRSIKAAVEFVANKSTLQSPDMVIVHDGARPYADEELLHQLVSDCYQHGVCATAPVSSSRLTVRSL